MAQSGKVWTAAELFTRNVGTKEDQDTAFPPHKIIGNIYYVGSNGIAQFLVTTPDGHFLLDSGFEASVPRLRRSSNPTGGPVASPRSLNCKRRTIPSSRWRSATR